MTSIRADKEQDSRKGVRAAGVRRRLAPVLASVTILLVAGTAIAAARGAFPWQDQETLNEAGCRNPDSIEQLVAAATTPDGRTLEFWTTRTGADAPINGHILVELDADGNRVGSGAGCAYTSEGDASSRYGEMWAEAASSGAGYVAAVIGHVPAEATVAVITLSDGTSAEVDAQTDGYFILLVYPSEGAGDSRFPEPVAIAALDDGGTVILEDQLGE